MSFSQREIPGIVSRAEHRTTLQVNVLRSLRLGVEWNPGASELHPLLNWRIMGETERRPAWQLSVSTDRIGTPDGTAYSTVVTKNLLPHSSRSLSPYVGLAYGTHEGKLRTVGGVSFGISPKRWSGLLIYDGIFVHPTVMFSHGPHAFTLLYVKAPTSPEDAGRRADRRWGIAYSVVFGGKKAGSEAARDREHGHEADHEHDQR